VIERTTTITDENMTSPPPLKPAAADARGTDEEGQYSFVATVAQGYEGFFKG